MVIPNTIAFMAEAAIGSRRERPKGAAPVPPLSIGLAAQVALDETLIGMMRTPKRFPRRADYTRVGSELRQARRLFEDQGWIDRPLTYHRTPPVPEIAHWKLGSKRGVDYEHIEWVSAYQPHPGEPGAERWQAFEANRHAHAWLVRAAVPTDTWLICVHGFGMGMPIADFQVFRAKKLAAELGLNLAFPILPLHGPRKQSFMAGTEFMSFDLMNPVLALTQAVWDTRSLMNWLERSEGARRFGLHGISLGGYTASLLTGIDERFETSIAGIPVTDFPSLFSHHSPAVLQKRAHEHGMLGEDAELVHRVISPLAMEPRVAPDRRFIYAALGDRMATADQAHRLWEHWGRPPIEWLEGGHVLAVVSPTVDRFVTESLTASGLLAGRPVELQKAATASA